ncbi:hypothetical protein ABG067_006539 [Albugo candida]
MSQESGLQSLERYKESYPLLPLCVISTLGDEELRKCQSDLQLLLEELTLSADDVQLSKYASRQLFIVQSTLRESVAMKRIATLLASNEDSPFSPVLDQQNATTNFDRMKQFERNTMDYKPRERVKAFKKITDVHRNTQNSFVISSVSPGLRKRASQTRQQAIKDEQRKSKEIIQRKNQRQVAYKRLLARQKLQEEKQRLRKLEEERKRQETPKWDHSAAVNSREEVYLSQSESESEVSNFSESDEETIQTLLPTLQETPADTKPGLVIQETALDRSLEEHQSDQDDSNFSIMDETIEDHVERVSSREEYACRLQTLMRKQHQAKCEQLASEKSHREEAEARHVHELTSDPIINAEMVEKQDEVTFYSPEEVAPNIDSTRVPRPLSPKVAEYHRYFRNFYCIFSGIYEQTHTLSTISSTTLPQQAEQVLRLQMKLYQGWQSIMQDYQTVFGKCTSETTISPLGVSTSPSTAHYRITFADRREVSEIVVAALQKLGPWEEHPSGLGLKTTWNLLWTWSKPNVERKTLLSWQRVNHFYNSKALTRKDNLKKSITKYIKMGGKLRSEYKTLMPKTFLLPQEYVAFIEAYHKTHCKDESTTQSPRANIWIMKPVASSRGRGISLVNDLNQLIYGENVVLQRYVNRPLLINGYKFDLRLFVLVTSFNPLEAFLYGKGFVRLCTRLYDPENLADLFIHLTNSSVQKANVDVSDTKWYSEHNDPQTAEEDVRETGTKKPLDYLWNWLARSGANVQSVKDNISKVVLLSLLCGEDHIAHQVNSFDLYGFDILLDADLKPWLIEINASPSMARENKLDVQVKDALMYDTIKLVNPLRFDRYRLVDILGRRLSEMQKSVQRVHRGNVGAKVDEENRSIRQMNLDLTAILDGHVPRCYGEMPSHLGHYERICPHTSMYNQLKKLKNGRKIATTLAEECKQQQ